MFARDRILAVDDNPTSLLIIAEALEPYYEFRAALDGNSALEIAYHFRPAVVLLDVMMPGLHGYEVCRRIKSDPMLRHSRVIMVSARTEIYDRLRGYYAGADDYLTKPFDEDELMAKIKVALQSRSADELESLQRRLEQLCGGTSEALALVSQLRDTETGVHLDRIRAISHILAAELRHGPYETQADDCFLDDLFYASVLHDVGKIALADNLLRKPEELTAEEQDQMKQHTVIGERIMNCFSERHPEVNLFRMAAAVARSHHECFDGSGYPDEIRGLAIPLAARIVKAADVFDGLASCEPYSGDYDLIRNNVLRRKAFEFDPLIVDAMSDRFDELVALCESNDVEEVLELTT